MTKINRLIAAQAQTMQSPIVPPPRNIATKASHVIEGKRQTKRIRYCASTLGISMSQRHSNKGPNTSRSPGIECNSAKLTEITELQITLISSLSMTPTIR